MTLSGPQQRLGVALSGGGFRAAFFHIGVLAQLARLGLLRHVEVISTVSGGAIIGSLYYLHLRKLLQTKTDDDITDEDYHAIIERIETEFFTAVQKNIRVRSFLNPLKLIMTCWPSYSRSDQLGYMFDEYLFRPVVDPGRAAPIEMRELRIQPKGFEGDFSPLKNNASRKHKVPIFIINATSLNTGHNWRFEAVRMGEPQRQTELAQEIDKMIRLRRPESYDEITPRQRNIELGLAVAASVGVPGLFPPLALSGLYSGIRVQLVDGGVHDNQGVQGLLDYECTHFIVSDASDQLRDLRDPATQIAPILLRATSVLMTRLREEQLFRLFETPDVPWGVTAKEGQPIAFLHLRKGMSAEGIAWTDSSGKPAEEPQTEREPRESFGVAEEVQEALSRIRTDLDAFTEVEAYALMLDAYKMTEPELKRALGIKDLLQPPASEEHHWKFLQIGPWLEKPNHRLMRRLTVGAERHFRWFRLKWPITVLLLLAAIAALVGLGNISAITEAIAALLDKTISVRAVALGVAAVLIAVLPEVVSVARVPAIIRLPVQVLVRFVTRTLAAVFISTGAAIQLNVIDPLYLREGRIDRLGPPAQE